MVPPFLRDSHLVQFPCALGFQSPKDSHASSSPWSVLQDGVIGGISLGGVLFFPEFWAPLFGSGDARTL